MSLYTEDYSPLQRRNLPKSTENGRNYIEDDYLYRFMPDANGTSALKPGRKADSYSPYLQKLSHSNLFGAPGSNQSTSRQAASNSKSSRSQRSQSRARSQNGSRADSRTNANDHYQFKHAFNEPRVENLETLDLNDESTLNNFQKFDSLHLSFRKEKPPLAQIHKRSESVNSLRSSARSRKKRYDKIPNVIKAVAYRNGSRDVSSLVTAKNIKEFLEVATERLGFGRAARRLFLENGDEITNEIQLLKYSTVYVSIGEDFKDPYLKTKKQIDQSKKIKWGSEGFLNSKEEYDESAPRSNEESHKNHRTSTITNSDRMMTSNRSTKRLLAFENGKEYNSTLVFMEYLNENKKNLTMANEEMLNLEKKFLNDFLADCQKRMKITNTLKVVYNWTGKQVKTLDNIPKLDKCLQNILDTDCEHSPVWLSKGENFIARGAYLFVYNLMKYASINRSKLAKQRAKIQKKLSKLDSDRADAANDSSAVDKQALTIKNIQIRETEFSEELRVLNRQIDELQKSIDTLEPVLTHLETLNDKQKDTPNEDLYQHIKKVDTKEKIFGGIASKGMRLKIYLNGTDTSFEMFFNLRDWASLRNDKDAQKIQLQFLLDEITKTFHKISDSSSKMVKFTRIFSDKGDEIKDINNIINANYEHVYVSRGENWKENRQVMLALSISCNILFAMMKKPPVMVQPIVAEERVTNVNDYHDDNESLDDSIKTSDDNDDKNANSDDDPEFNFPVNKYLQKKSNIQTASSKANEPSTNKQDNYDDYDMETYILPFRVTNKENKDKPRHTTVPTLINPDYARPQCWNVLGEQNALERLSECKVAYDASLTGNEAVQLDLNKAKRLVICSQKEHDLFLYPQLTVSEKINKAKTNDGSAAFLSHFQEWKLNKNGYIYSSFVPQICLTLNTSVVIKLEIKLRNKGKNMQSSDSLQIVKKGYLVEIGIRQLNDQNYYRDLDQQWAFNKYANIYSKALSDKQTVLTSTDVLLTEMNGLSKQNGIVESYELSISDSASSNFRELNSRETSLFVLESFERSSWPTLASSQRWAVKQESYKSIGEWRHSKLSSAVWHKMALTWPVDEQENLIEEFKWPLTGCLLPGAPPLKDTDTKSDETNTKFRILKNGQINDQSAMLVGKLDKRSLIKEYIHCSDVTYRKFEFTTFLDACASALNLSSAARRIFDENGQEHFDLSNLKENQLIYVSCGEAWINPKLVKDEQDNKSAVSLLTADLNKIAFFMQLRNVQDLVIEIQGMVAQEGASLVLAKCCLSSHELNKLRTSVSIDEFYTQNENYDDKQETYGSFHEKSHKLADKQSRSWRRRKSAARMSKSQEDLSDHSLDDSLEEPSRRHESNNYELSNSMKSLRLSEFLTTGNEKKHNMKFNSQRFVYNKSTGFIHSFEAPDLVVTFDELENNSSQVMLMKKNEDNVNQRWVYSNDKCVIFSKYRSNLVLSVKLPSLENVNLHDLEDDDEFERKSVLDGAMVVVQTYVDFEHGNSNQKWNIDSFGFIYAFNANQDNKDITAAHKAGICTYYITQDKEISQPGYVMTIESKPPRREKICKSCIGTVREKFNSTRITENKTFVCFVGKTKDRSMKQLDCFKYLQEKVNLSPSECENTFTIWKEKLISLRKQINAKYIMNQLSSGKTVNIIRGFVYKNGNDREKGQLIVGTSIQNLLDQASVKLDLAKPAKRFYTQDGTTILDVTDLTNWIFEFYTKQLKQMETVDENEKKMNTPEKHSTSGSKSFNTPNRLELKRVIDLYNNSSQMDERLLLRWPIEMWASSGEPFIALNATKQAKETKIIKKQQLLKKTDYQSIRPNEELSNDQLNIVEASNIVAKKIQNSTNKNQTQPVEFENVSFRREKTSKQNFTLVPSHINMPIKKKLRIYLNGNSPEKAIEYWALNLDEIKEVVKKKFGINRDVKFIFDQNGKKINDFDSLTKNQLICASTGGEFLSPESKKKEQEIKANWSRSNKLNQNNSEYIIDSKKNPFVGVDPFAPSSLKDIEY